MTALRLRGEPLTSDLAGLGADSRDADQRLPEAPALTAVASRGVGRGAHPRLSVDDRSPLT